MVNLQSRIRRQFDRSASGAYDRHAAVQKKMAHELVYHIARTDGAAPTRSMLEIGCGTGYLTKLMLDRYPLLDELTALDIAPAMLEAARHRILHSEAAGIEEKASGFLEHEPMKPRSHPHTDDPVRPRFILADIEDWAATAPSMAYELIVSNACFQWLTQPKATLLELRRMLGPGGRLAFATFGPGTFYELHGAFDEAYYSLGQPPQRHGLSFLSSQDWYDRMAEAGFSNIRQSSHRFTEQFPSVRDFLNSVKSIGAGVSEASARSGMSSRSLFQHMFQAYEEKFGSGGCIPATYEVLIFQASV